MILYVYIYIYISFILILEVSDGVDFLASYVSDNGGIVKESNEQESGYEWASVNVGITVEFFIHARG